MKINNTNTDETKTMILVPQSFLNALMEKQDKILAAMETKDNAIGMIGDYISEIEAKKILGRKSTWFWNLRKQGLLPYTTAGKKIFYSKADILKFIELNKKGGNNE